MTKNLHGSSKDRHLWIQLALWDESIRILHQVLFKVVYVCLKIYLEYDKKNRGTRNSPFGLIFHDYLEII